MKYVPMLMLCLLAGCTGMSDTQQRMVSGAAIGGALGGIVGAGIGGGIGWIVDATATPTTPPARIEARP